MEPVSRSAFEGTPPELSRSSASGDFADTLARVTTTDPGVSESNFALWWKETPRYESSLAAWEKNPLNRADRGGRTQLGITERTFRRSAKVAGLPSTAEAFAAMSHAQARAIAHSLWTVSGAHQIRHPAVALVVFDWFWGSNSQGLRNLKDALRRCGHAVPEGASLDPTTVAALNEVDPERLVLVITEARHAHHQAIADADATQRVFLDGWQRRTEERRDEALALIDSASRGNPCIHGEIELPEEERRSPIPTTTFALVTRLEDPTSASYCDPRSPRADKRASMPRRVVRIAG